MIPRGEGEEGKRPVTREAVIRKGGGGEEDRKEDFGNEKMMQDPPENVRVPLPSIKKGETREEVKNY